MESVHYAERNTLARSGGAAWTVAGSALLRGSWHRRGDLGGDSSEVQDVYDRIMALMAA